MYVCAQLFIIYVCVLSLLNWNVAILLFIEYDANKIKTIKCHLCHVCAQLFISYVCMCSVIYKLCKYVIYWMWCKRNKDNYNVPASYF